MIYFNTDQWQEPLLFNAQVNLHIVSLFVDTGASVNLMSKQCFQRIRPSGVCILEPSQFRLCGVNGHCFETLGTCRFDVYLAPDLPPLSLLFHVIDDPTIPAELLLGNPDLAHYGIDIYPRLKSIYYKRRLIHHRDYDKELPPVGTVYTLTSTQAAKESNPPVNTSQSITIEDFVSNPTTSCLNVPNNTVQASESQSLLSKRKRRARKRQFHKRKTKHIFHVTTTAQPATPEEEDASTPLAAQVPIQEETTNIFAGCDVTLYPLTCTLVPIKSSIPLNHVAITQPESVRHHAIIVPEALVTFNKSVSQIYVFNTTNTFVNLSKNSYIFKVNILNAPIKEVNLPPVAHIASVLTTNDNVRTKIDENLKPLEFDARESLLSLLSKYRSTIALPGESLGRTDIIQHNIRLETPDPTYIPAYRMPHSKKDTLEKHIQTMLEDDVIESSTSPFNSPIFLVPKANGEWRPVVDFRALNKKTIPPRYPMPVLEQILQSLGDKNCIFSTLDLHAGFWQIEMSPECQEYTAFSTPSGHYQFKRMPFGLVGAPATFQRLINSIFAGILGVNVFAYLDDIIIVSKSIPDHIEKLELVLSKLQDAGLKLKLNKCKFFQRKTEFLGHVIDEHGIHTSNDKTQAITDYPIPQNVDQVRSFLGLSGYYRKFIKNYAQISSPLSKLLCKDVPFKWSDEQQKAFNTMKDKLTSSPVLAYPNFTQPFTLYTDASYTGLGAVLTQKNNGKECPIAYASRLLNKSEKNYSVTHIEALAVVWALKKFRYLIYGYDINVKTDHQALLHLFAGKNLTGRLARWFLTIQDFMPNFEYIKGKTNVAADALSRHVAPVTTVQPITTFNPPTKDEIVHHQRIDPVWSRVIQALETNDFSNFPKVPSPHAYTLQDNVLYKKAKSQNKHEPSRLIFQIVIPSTLVPQILPLIHDSPHAAHPGRERCLAQARLRYFWISMSKDISAHIDICHNCNVHKGRLHKSVPMLSYPVTQQPWDTVAIDLLKLPQTENGNKYLFVAIDHFSRFSILVPLKNKSANAVAQVFLDHVICPFTTPKNLLSDNGGEFVNEVLNSLCQLFHINKCTIVPYRPSANGLVERQNRKILNVLRSLVSSNDLVWDTYIPQVAATLNGALHKSISETPHFVIFGIDKRLPYDLLHETPKPVYNLDDFVKVNVHSFQQIHKRVQESLALSKQEMLLYHNKNASNFNLDISDIVYSLVHHSTSKLDPKFEGPFRVLAKPKNNKVQLLNLKTFEKCTAHIDHLKKINKTVDHLVPCTNPNNDIVNMSNEISTNVEINAMQNDETIAMQTFVNKPKQGVSKKTLAPCPYNLRSRRLYPT